MDWGRGTVTDERGVVGGCWEKREAEHLCTLGAGHYHRATFPMLIPLFSFIYPHLPSGTRDTPSLSAYASIFIRRETPPFPASRNALLYL